MLMKCSWTLISFLILYLGKDLMFVVIESIYGSMHLGCPHRLIRWFTVNGGQSVQELSSMLNISLYFHRQDIWIKFRIIKNIGFDMNDIWWKVTFVQVLFTWLLGTQNLHHLLYQKVFCDIQTVFRLSENQTLNALLCRFFNNLTYCISGKIISWV